MEKTLKCFSFKAHLIVDVTYGLPVEFVVTHANRSDVAEGKKLLEVIGKSRPGILGKCRYSLRTRLSTTQI